MKQKLIVENDVTLCKGKFKSLVARQFTNSETGFHHEWEMVKRKTCGRCVGVAAITPAHEVILIKIFRIAQNRYVLDVCGGHPDKKGELDVELTRRELLAETGYTVDALEEMFSGALDAVLLEEEVVYFLGTNARKVAEPKLDDAEDIEVLKIPLGALRQYLTHPPDGVLVDIKLWGVLGYLEHKYLQQG